MKKILSFLSSLGKFWQTTSHARLLRLSFLCLLIQIVTIALTFAKLPPEIPIFFSQVWGKNWLSTPTSLLLLPFLSLLVFIVNYSLAFFFYTKKVLLSQLLVVFSFIFSLLATISVLKIIQLAL